MYSKIIEFLNKNHATYRVLEHEVGDTPQKMAEIRGNDIHRSIKVLVYDATIKNVKHHFMLVIPMDHKIDSKKIRSFLKSTSLKANSNLTTLTGYTPGAASPFSFVDNVTLLVDQTIPDFVTGEIVMNAGEFGKSIFMEVSEYLRITAPMIADISKPEIEPGISSTLVSLSIYAHDDLQSSTSSNTRIISSPSDCSEQVIPVKNSVVLIT